MEMYSEESRFDEILPVIRDLDAIRKRARNPQTKATIENAISVMEDLAADLDDTNFKIERARRGLEVIW